MQQHPDIYSELRDSINCQVLRGIRSSKNVRTNYISGRIPNH